jgi:hypothetical protein
MHAVSRCKVPLYRVAARAPSPRLFLANPALAASRLLARRLRLVSNMIILVFFLLLWLSVGLMVVGVLGRAFALTLLWAWFVVPTFGAEPLSLPIAAGLITLTYLVFGPKRDPGNLRALRQGKEKDDEDKTTLRESMQQIGYALSHELMTPALAIVIGWMFKQAVGA